MEFKKYENWSLGIHQSMAAKRIPTDGSIEVSRRCPLSCAHCYNNLALRDQKVLCRELTYNEHCRILDEITEAGCLWLLYTGGEIFVRKDFLDIYTYAKTKGLLITLFTNGTLITPEIADHLAQWPPFSIEITIYGRTREIHEKVTRLRGSYDQCWNGIHLLRERGLSLKLKTMAITLNKHEIWEMKHLVEDDLGLEFRFDATINPRIDCTQTPLALRLTPREVIELDLKDPQRMREWKLLLDRFKGIDNSPEYADELYQCGGGINSFSIDPYGMLNICSLSCADSYDLRQGTFKEGWENFIFGLRHKKISVQTKCVGCALKSLCGMCPANGELENMDSEGPVDFLCEVAHLRARALGFPIPPHGECEYCDG
ncbi:MAG: radical SAM protein [bacterium]